MAVANRYTYVPYKETGYFSKLVNDYLGGHNDTVPFYDFAPDADGINKAIAARERFPVNREVLVKAVSARYAGLNVHEKTLANIALLKDASTYTVCTAHQPNLLTGYLYFVYKILHAIRLAEELTVLHPGKHFVPVYYMGSEDNDIDELGTFKFREAHFVWDGSGQEGAVGRMDTAGLKPLLHDLFRQFGPPGKDCDDLQGIIHEAYLKHKTVGEATLYLVNELFGRFGLVVVNPDDALLKACFVPVMEDELLHQHAYPIISEQIAKLGAHYKIQAQPRPINLFYLNTQVRERIEKNGDKWVVLNTDIEWTQEALLTELHAHPERFSPNVMLRGLFQETILPNVVFIGGGAEVAYWLQFKTLFAHYGVFYPNIQLRQSVMWMDKAAAVLKEGLGYDSQMIFKPEQVLIQMYVDANSTSDWHTTNETAAIENIFAALKQKAMTTDVTLGPAAEAVLTRMRKQLHNLEAKMLRAEKKKMAVQLERISRLKRQLFPGNGLQERVDNFAEYYLDNGPAFFDVIVAGIRPLDNQFLIIEG
jgi:bacillithiol biosynthesis cysteine-adding enzyme BshC